MNVKELKSAALKDAYRLKSYQGKVKQQCKRLEFVDGLILKVSDYVDHSGQYSRPLVELVMILSRIQNRRQAKLLALVKERDETLYHYNETLSNLDKKLDSNQFEPFICRKYLTDLWNGNANFENYMEGLEK